MTWKLSLKKGYAGLLYRAGIVTALKGFHGRKNIVLGYHRVLPRGSDELRYLQPGMYVTTETFEKHMEYLAGQYTVRSLSGLSSLDSVQGACFVTFDDGWADTYEHAFPIMKRYNIPATVFVSTNLMGSGTMLWSHTVSIYVHHASGGQLAGIRDILAGHADEKGKGEMARVISSPDRNGFLEAAIGVIKGLDARAAEIVMSELESSMGGVDRYAEVGRQWLTWDEIGEMSSHGISFGSHAHNHKILTKLGDNEIINEVETSREMLRAKLGRDAYLFSYPNGDYDGRVIGVLKGAGFRLGFTTRAGFVSHSCSPFAIGRVLVHEDATSTTPMYACKLTRCVP